MCHICEFSEAWLPRQALYVNDSTCWLNSSREAVQASVSDVLGNQLLAKGNPSFAELRRAIPPMVMSSPTSIKGDPSTGTTHTFVGSRSSVTNMAFDVHGADVNGMGYPSMGTVLNKYHRSAAVFKDPLDEQEQQEGLWGGYLPITSNYFKLAAHAGPAHSGCTTTPQPCPAHPGRTFCASDRSTGQCDKPSVKKCPPCPAPPPAGPCRKPCAHNPHACCECTGGNATCPGQPISTSPCCRPGDTACCKRFVAGEQAGAAGGTTVSSAHGTTPGGGYIEMTVVPVAEMDGNMEQAGWFRFQKTAANGTVLVQKFYDTFAYTAGAFQSPTQVPASGEPAGSATAQSFYAAVLEQQSWWGAELAREGVMGMSLPDDPGPYGSDGPTLKDMALHSIVRDMITRRQTFFPQYGVLPGSYGQPMANGFPETFWGTMTMALELGLEEYSQGVMENWLKYYVRSNGTTM